MTAAVFDILARTVRASLSASLDLRPADGRAAAIAARPGLEVTSCGEQRNEPARPLPANGFEKGLGRSRPRNLIGTWSCDQGKTMGTSVPLCAVPARVGPDAKSSPRVVGSRRSRQEECGRNGRRILSWRSRAPDPERSGAGRTPFACQGAAKPELRNALPFGVSRGCGSMSDARLANAWSCLSHCSLPRESVRGRAQPGNTGGTCLSLDSRRISRMRQISDPPFLETEGYTEGR